MANAISSSLREASTSVLARMQLREVHDLTISQARKRHKMLSNLPKLCDMNIFFFQSINRSVVTKEELMHRIIGSCLDIVDRGEVEDQLCLLEKLVPEWIPEKLAANGDPLICVNKIMSFGLLQDRGIKVGKKVKRLRTDNVLEFCSSDFGDFYKGQGIMQKRRKKKENASRKRK